MKKALAIAIWIISILVSIKVYEFMILHWLKKEFEKFKDEDKKPDRVDYSHLYRNRKKDELEEIQKEFDKIVNETSVSFETLVDVYHDMKKYFEEDGFVNAATFLDLIGSENQIEEQFYFLCEKYGWDDLSDFHADTDKKNGHKFHFPPLKLLKK